MMIEGSFSVSSVRLSKSNCEGTKKRLFSVFVKQANKKPPADTFSLEV